ncbi:MAG: hypothetical protein J5892_03270 [Bacilli bacterium]|nr:hypothetical protein [Bacilli bacterium]
MDRIEKEGLNTIRLETLVDYFTPENIGFLADHHFYCLGDLFEAANQANFYEMFKNEQKQYMDIVGSIKILKCKYLDEDPFIDINDSYTRIEEVAFRMGFKFQTRKELVDNKIKTVKELFELVNKNGFNENHFFSPSSINEIKAKCGVVFNYGRIHQFNNSIELLKNDFAKLKVRNDVLDVQLGANKKKVGLF